MTMPAPVPAEELSKGQRLNLACNVGYPPAVVSVADSELDPEQVLVTVAGPAGEEEELPFARRFPVALIP